MLKTICNMVTLACLLAATAISPARAQGEQAARIVGTVERVDGSELVVRTAQGERAVRVPPEATVFALVKATLADVKPGVFVGVGAIPQPDDSQQAVRIMIFPESLRGLGEGHRPWDRPGTTMTNATVDTAVTGVDGQILTVRYKGGEKKIVVRPDTALVTYVTLDRGELKPGANVTVNAVVRPGGSIEARRVVVNRESGPSS